MPNATGSTAVNGTTRRAVKKYPTQGDGEPEAKEDSYVFRAWELVMCGWGYSGGYLGDA